MNLYFQFYKELLSLLIKYGASIFSNKFESKILQKRKVFLNFAHPKDPRAFVV